MPFENWDIVHYVIVSDVIVSHQFVIQSHPSLQSALYIGKAIGEHVWRQENLHFKLLLSSLIIYLLNRLCTCFPKPEIYSNSRGAFTEVSKLPRGAPAEAGWRGNVPKPPLQLSGCVCNGKFSSQMPCSRGILMALHSHSSGSFPLFSACPPPQAP